MTFETWEIYSWKRGNMWLQVQRKLKRTVIKVHFIGWQVWGFMLAKLAAYIILKEKCLCSADLIIVPKIPFFKKKGGGGEFITLADVFEEPTGFFGILLILAM